MGNEEFRYFEVCPVYSTMSMSNESRYQKLGSLSKDCVCSYLLCLLSNAYLQKVVCRSLAEKT